jgi:ABC-2 type transport system permease protein
MKFLEIFRFEFAHQIRRPWPWLAFGILFIFAAVTTRVSIVPATLPQDFILNSPFIIAAVTVICCQIWLLVAPAVSGEAAARDVQTGMYALVYASPISKAEYLGGRFAAACALHALILLGTQFGSLFAVYGPGAYTEFVGPFRPMAYIAAYGLLALPNVLIATSMQFTAALFSGRPMAAYVGSFALFFLSYPVTLFLYLAGMGRTALLLDPIGVLAIMNEMMTEWTIIEKNVRMFGLEGMMVWNRLLWVGIALATVLLMYLRFSFAHRASTDVLSQVIRWLTGTRPVTDAGAPVNVVIRAPNVRQSFGFTTHLRQMLAVGRTSFRTTALSPAGLFLLLVYPAFLVLIVTVQTEHWGVQFVPRTSYIVPKFLTAPLTHFSDFRVIVPLLIIFLAGETIWRERDAGLHEKVDATSVPDWVLTIGKLLGLGFVLVALMATVAAAGMIAQTINGYYDYDIGLYARLLLGLQLPDYLLLAVLALTVHTIVNHKHVGMLVALALFFVGIFAGQLGIEQNLLIYGAGPWWSFTDIRGFGSSLEPWLWFRLYWAAWALLFAIAARLLWVRGRETGFGARLRGARRGLTRGTAGPAALALALIAVLGGFIFYNTNVLNEHITEDDKVRRRAAYEILYGHYEGIPQPVRTHTSLHIEIYPERGTAMVRGSYQLVNAHDVPIPAVHIEPAFYVETRTSFDRAYEHVLADDTLGHHIYQLAEPLQPGDSVTLNFEVEFTRRGFTQTGGNRQIVANGSHFASGAFPVIGYQPLRELWSAHDRIRYGLPRQVTLPPPGDIDPAVGAVPPATFEAIIGTAPGQVAVAPGELRRTWREGGRSYFHYGSDVPLSGTEFFFSANYAVHRERFNDIDLQVFLYPGHTANLERVLRSARASLEYFSAQFGPYPYPFLQIVEQPGNFLGMGVDGSGVVTGGEGIFLLNPQDDDFDVISDVVAHELGHQWWGMQLRPAFAAGGGVISESLAWYSAMQLVRHMKGREALRRLMSFMRQPNPWPQIRTGLPLLSAMDPWANYRKGPYAFHALSEYAGEARVNAALRRLIETHRDAGGLATTLDMYRELQAAVPDSLHPLLHDLFEVSTFWSFDTKQASAMQTPDGMWQVTLDVEARKVVADSAGIETELQMDEWIEIGVFAAGSGRRLGAPLHLRKHRIRSGRQTIVVMVEDRPARAGIDPYNLLDWDEGDNIEPVTIQEKAGTK